MSFQRYVFFEREVAKAAREMKMKVVIGEGIAPISKMRDRGLMVCLGTDGPASSNRLDIWEVGKIASLLQKGINLDPSKLPAKEVIKMMTVNGMRTLNIKDLDRKKISEIEKEIEKEKDFSFLYQLNVNELTF